MCKDDVHVACLLISNRPHTRACTLLARFQGALLRAIRDEHTPAGKVVASSRPAIQLYTCFDDRQGSFRRYVEETDPAGIETYAPTSQTSQEAVAVLIACNFDLRIVVLLFVGFIVAQ